MSGKQQPQNTGAFALDDAPGDENLLEESSIIDAPENSMPLHGAMHMEHASEEHFEGEAHADEIGTFIPEGSLEAPPPRAGFQQYWVRMGVFGKPDAQNRASMTRLGWTPRALASVPHGIQRQYPAFHHKSFGDVIMQGDLVLCERPAALGAMEAKYYRERAQRQTGLTDVLKSGPASQGGFHQVEVVERRRKVITRRPIQAADGG